MENLEAEVEAAERNAAAYAPAVGSSDFEFRMQKLLGHERVVRIGAGGVALPHRAAWLEAMALRPDLVARLFDAQAERAVRNVPFLVEHGFRHFFGGGDFSSNAGPFYSPRLFRELVCPRLKRITEECHRHGAYHLFASDGDLWPVADDLFGAGTVDGYYEIDRSVGMHIPELRRRYPQITLIGNLASQTLHLGSREDVVRETTSCMEEAAEAGGTIVGVSNLVVPGTPVENIMAMLETMRKLR